MFTVALYTFGPLAYSHLDVLPRRKVGFRGIFAASTVLLGIGFQLTSRLSEVQRASALLAIGLLGAFACGSLLWAYLVRFHKWDLTNPHGRAVGLLELVTPHQDAASEIRSDLAHEGWLGRIATTSFLLAVILILSLPIVLAAFVVQVLFYAFPIPDLVFLWWSVSARLLPLVPIAPDRRRVAHLRFDFEEFLIDTIENATRSFMGMLLTIWIILGLLVSSIYFFLAVTVAPTVFEGIQLGLGALLTGFSIEVVLVLWNRVGILLVLLFAGSHGLWVWIRELHRLPHFLDIWEGRSTRWGVTPMIRVPGFILVAVTGLLLTITIVLYPDSRPVAISYAVLWPGLVILGIRTIRQPYRRSGRTLPTEHIWIVAGLILQVVSFWLAAELEQVVNALLGDNSVLPVLTVPIGMTVLILIATAIILIERHERQYDDLRRYSLVGILFVLGILAGGSSQAVPAQYEVLAIGFSIAGWGGGLLLGITRYYDL